MMVQPDLMFLFQGPVWADEVHNRFSTHLCPLDHKYHNSNSLLDKPRLQLPEQIMRWKLGLGFQSKRLHHVFVLPRLFAASYCNDRIVLAGMGKIAKVMNEKVIHKVAFKWLSKIRCQSSYCDQSQQEPNCTMDQSELQEIISCNLLKARENWIAGNAIGVFLFTGWENWCEILRPITNTVAIAINLNYVWQSFENCYNTLVLVTWQRPCLIS